MNSGAIIERLSACADVGDVLQAFLLSAKADNGTSEAPDFIPGKLVPGRRLITLLLSAALGLTPFALPAQTDPGKPAGSLKIGHVEGDVQYSKLTPSLWHFVGRITFTSDNYDLAAEDIQVFLLPGKGGKAGASSLEKVTADGAADKQVDVHVRRPLQSEAFEILSDHAVYVPDKARPGYGQMDFTGHVTVNTRSGFWTGHRSRQWARRRCWWGRARIIRSLRPARPISR